MASESNLKTGSRGGRLLRKHRENRGLNQKELAEWAGVAPSQVCRWESGQTRPSVEHIVRLFMEAGIPVESWIQP